MVEQKKYSNKALESNALNMSQKLPLSQSVPVPLQMQNSDGTGHAAPIVSPIVSPLNPGAGGAAGLNNSTNN